jgi:hypothetical protein
MHSRLLPPPPFSQPQLLLLQEIAAPRRALSSAPCVQSFVNRRFPSVSVHPVLTRAVPWPSTRSEWPCIHHGNPEGQRGRAQHRLLLCVLRDPSRSEAAITAGD